MFVPFLDALALSEVIISLRFPSVCSVPVDGHTGSTPSSSSHARMVFPLNLPMYGVVILQYFLARCFSHLVSPFPPDLTDYIPLDPFLLCPGPLSFFHIWRGNSTHRQSDQATGPWALVRKHPVPWLSLPIFRHGVPIIHSMRSSFNLESLALVACFVPVWFFATNFFFSSR